MAVEQSIAERVYQDVRKRIFAGEFHLRQRLDVGSIARRAGASATPVREALVRLAAERLITPKPPHGFFLLLWSENELEALYLWRWSLTRLALVERQASSGALNGLSGDNATATARLFQALEGRVNVEIRRAGANADDRLHAARLAEQDLFDDIEAERAMLAQHVSSGEARAASGALRRYYRRRLGVLRRLRERAVLRLSASNGE